MASKLCDSCKSATAALYCRPDAAFLCLSCDSKIHAANKLASRHARVWMCEVCEQAPAHVTCKADAAALCVTCDRDIHSANPLARRHERVPVTPFYDSVSGGGGGGGGDNGGVNKHTAVNFLDDCYFTDLGGNGNREEEEEEAASWLLPNPKTTVIASAAEAVPGDSPEMNTGQQFLFSDPDPYLDLDYGTVDPKLESPEQNSSGTDGVVPGENRTVRVPTVNENCFELDFTGGSKGFTYGYNCISHSQVSSSSLEVGVVPDGGSVADVSYSYGGAATSGTDPGTQRAVPLTSAEREARVMRYREKRKNRKFEKTIRYASRKAYAEMRPRIKGRFAKRTDAAESNDVVDRSAMFGGFGLVPTF